MLDFGDKKPLEVVRFNDKQMIPKNESAVYNAVKIAFVSAIAATLVASLIFGEFLFEGSKSFWVICLITASYLLKCGGYKREECPCELRFFEDFVEMYIPRHYIKKSRIKSERQVMYYKDVKDVVYRTGSRKYCMFGMVEETHFLFEKSGELSSTPCYHKRYDGMIGFYTLYAEDKVGLFRTLLSKYVPVPVREVND